MTATPDQPAGGGLRFVIDSELCAGHGRCYALAPESFEADDVGYGRTLEVVHGVERRAAMETVAIACPEEAITIVPASPAS